MIHKGKTGTWKDLMTPEMIERFEEWETKSLKGSDLKITYEI